MSNKKNTIYLEIMDSNTSHDIDKLLDKIIDQLDKNAGNGLFAGKDYKKGDLVEINNFILLKSNNVDGLLFDYIFNHSYDDNYCIANLGNISLINHSIKNANVNPYDFDLNKKEQKCFATKDIKKGEEFLYDYGNSYIENHPNINLND